MYNYIVKFTYGGERYECVFSNEALFTVDTEEEILANQASEAANNCINCCKLRKPNICIGELCLYRVVDEELIWKKK